MSKEERRRCPRRSAALNVLIQANNIPRKVFPGRIENYSSEGVGIELNPKDAEQLLSARRIVIQYELLSFELDVVGGKPSIRQGQRRNVRTIGAKSASSGFTVDFLAELAESGAYPTDGQKVYEINEENRERVISDLFAAYGKSNPLENILYRMIYNAGCELIIAQQSRMQSAYGGFAHREYRSGERPVRLSFLSKDGHFFGYTEIRPTRFADSNTLRRHGHIGRTLLRYPEGGKQLRSCGQSVTGDHTFLVLRAPYRAILWGSEQHLDIVPYEQQAVIHGSCGHAATAMATNFWAHLFRSRHCTQEEVAELAGRAPTEALTERDIMLVFHKLGISARCYVSDIMKDGRNLLSQFPSAIQVPPNAILELTHFAADSFLPAILCLRQRMWNKERHAVLCVGHTGYGRGRNPNVLYGTDTEKQGSVGVTCSLTSWVKDFLVHDEAIGPYLRLPLYDEHPTPQFTESPPNSGGTDAEAAPDQQRSERLDTSEYEWHFDRSAKGHIDSVLVPLPRGVNLCPLTAYRTGVQIIATFLSTHADGNRPTKGTPILDRLLTIASNDMTGIVTGIYLDHSDRYRVKMCQRLNRNQAEWRALSNARLPPYVYIVTVLLAEDIALANTLEADALGYVLLDPSTVELSSEIVLFSRIGEYLSYIHSLSGEVVSCFTPYEQRKQPTVVGAYEGDVMTPERAPSAFTF